MQGDPETVRFSSGALDLHGRLRRCGPDAPAFVLLSGVGFHSFEYEPLAADLAAAGISSLSFDYRGHGRSDGRRGDWRLSELVTDSRRAVDLMRSSCDGPLVLFGNSLGAMVAVLAGAVDDRVQGVAASNCPARIADFMLTRPRRALFGLAKLAAPLVPMRISLNHFYSYDQLIDDPSWVATIEGDASIGDARRLSVSTFRELIDSWDGRAAVRDLHKPLLLIQGRNDRMQPPKQSELLYEAANDPSAYEVVETGHLPHLEDPEMIAGMLAEWLAALTSGIRGR